MTWLLQDCLRIYDDHIDLVKVEDKITDNRRYSLFDTTGQTLVELHGNKIKLIELYDEALRSTEVARIKVPEHSSVSAALCTIEDQLLLGYGIAQCMLCSKLIL
jgi:hypothetical protein